MCPCSSCAIPYQAALAPSGRRRLLAGAGAALALAGGALSSPAQALLAAPALWSRPRELWITRPQAQESTRSVYWADARLQPDGYAAIIRIYRDLHANAQWPIALALLDLNFVLQLAVGRVAGRRPLVLLSGYRTAQSNRLVGGTTPNVHGAGLADDYIYEGLSLAQNHRLARHFQLGGLGLYPERGSLHKDVGPLRSWTTRGR